jgi:hypothetical protein
VEQQLEVLNSAAHAALRMHASPTEHPHFVPIGLNEFSRAAAVCPIFFAKDAATGEFYAAAMFGFRPGELLMEEARSGAAAFRPLDVQRQGFFIVGDDIAVDRNHPRFASNAATSLFDESGEPSDALRGIQRAIGQLKMGIDATQGFIRELLALKLIEPIDINLSFDDGEKMQLDGLYTVSRDNLAELEDSQILGLFRKGFLQAVYTIVVSLEQVNTLARRRNRQQAVPL